ncbi:MAG TPA: carboxypeptidase regulatory-like domain-containing protein [Longimicrobiales bacterium]|nr:carboxypeptidase regulatory-like domain-containing protein [Longimicrobiales bacterium]
MFRSAAWLSLALLVWPGIVDGQFVRGIVREAGTQAPLRGVFVVLRPADNAFGQVAALTGPDGQFFLRAPTSGNYQLKAERIGYDSAAVATFALAANETKAFELVLTISPLVLPEVSVRGRGQCVARPETAAEAARVWEETRKALTVAAWVGSDTAAVYRVRQYARRLDRSLRPDGEDAVQYSELRGRHTFLAMPADDLIERGFVQRAGDQLNYFGPDAELLTSPAFLSQYCFRLERNKDRSQMIGLHFEPVKGRRLPDIRGTLWLDTRTSALHFIEYEFVNLPFAVPTRFANGRTEYEQLANGGWIVKHWHIRMPVLMRARSRAVAVGAQEAGGEVLDATLSGGLEVALTELFDVSGTVHDSIRNRPLANVQARLEDTPFYAVTDSLGAFRIERVPAGEFSLVISGPRLDSIPGTPPRTSIKVKAPARPWFLATPSAPTLRARFCPGTQLDSAAVRYGLPVTAVGFVRVLTFDAESGGPVADIPVRLVWSMREEEEPAFDDLSSPLRAQTDENGVAIFCGIPAGARFALGAQLGEAFAKARFQPFPADGVLQIGLRIDR